VQDIKTATRIQAKTGSTNSKLFSRMTLRQASTAAGS
jgi:hypothetical protein